MKKAAIVTLTKDLNYGNRLQNYAVERLVSEYGYSVATLFNSMWSVYNTTSRFKSYISIPLTWLRNKELGVFRQTVALFDRFNYKYIHFRDYYDINYSMDAIADKYDVFITGSDQVWNPYWEFIGENEYLTFAKKKKKIALSASFGVSIIPEEKKKKIAEWLNGLDAISVREDRAAEIVYELTGINAPVLVDPTMCITSEEWSKMARRPLFMKNRPYVLMYVLGEMQAAVENAVNTYCKAYKADLIVLKNNKIYNNCPIGPREYLYLIANADYVITDSFHGSVFSILFHRNLAVFHRGGGSKSQDMISRLDTLLKKFSLENCLMCDEWFPFHSIDSEKWMEIDGRLEIYRKQVRDFLSSELK